MGTQLIYLSHVPYGYLGNKLNQILHNASHEHEVYDPE